MYSSYKLPQQYLLHYNSFHFIAVVSATNSSIGISDQVWIGAQGTDQDQHFSWIDGNAFAYTNWLAGKH
jgi:hypothetical protein